MVWNFREKMIENLSCGAYVLVMTSTLVFSRRKAKEMLKNAKCTFRLLWAIVFLSRLKIFFEQTSFPL